MKKTTGGASSMKRTAKKATTVGAVAAAALLGLGVAAAGAQAAEVQQPVGRFTAWERAGWTPESTDSTRPADPDGTDPYSTTNLIKYGSYARQRKEYGEPVWLTAEEAAQLSAESWEYLEESQVVVIEEGHYVTRPVPDHWQRYSWTGGPVTNRDQLPPLRDADGRVHPNWNANTASDPHGKNAVGPYDVSKGGSGKSDWFYLEWVTGATKRVWVPEVTQTQYKYVPFEMLYSYKIWTREFQEPAGYRKWVWNPGAEQVTSTPVWPEDTRGEWNPTQDTNPNQNDKLGEVFRQGEGSGSYVYWEPFYID